MLAARSLVRHTLHTRPAALPTLYRWSSTSTSTTTDEGSPEMDETGEPLIPKVSVSYSEAWMGEAEAAAVARVMESNRLVMGPETKEFESRVAAFAGVEHAVAVSSGTAALSTSLAALGIGPGWKVALPAYTWVATYNAVVHAGATPVLVDVDPLEYTLQEAETRQALAEAGGEEGKVAVMPVHMFGLRAGSGWLRTMAEDEGVTVLGDGCCAFGGMAGGERCGSWTPVETFSFHPRKVVGTGEGGMVLTNDKAVAETARALRDHGARRSEEQRRQTVEGGVMVPEFELGFNFRISELHAAIGNAQMGRVGELMRARRDAGALYDLLLEDGPTWLLPPPLHAGGRNPGSDQLDAGDDRILTFYPTTLWGTRNPDAIRDFVRAYGAGESSAVSKAAKLGAWRDRLMTDVAAAGVAVRPPMISLPNLPYVQETSGVTPDMFPASSLLFDLTFALPLHHKVTKDNQRYLARLLREIPASWSSTEEREAAVDRVMRGSASERE